MVRGNIPLARMPGALDGVVEPEEEATEEVGVVVPIPVAVAVEGVTPVRTLFMSSPEHWNTSMYRCFLPKVMLRWWRCCAAWKAACALLSWMKASPVGVP